MTEGADTMHKNLHTVTVFFFLLMLILRLSFSYQADEMPFIEGEVCESCAETGLHDESAVSSQEEADLLLTEEPLIEDPYPDADSLITLPEEEPADGQEYVLLFEEQAEEEIIAGSEDDGQSTADMVSSSEDEGQTEAGLIVAFENPVLQESVLTDAAGDAEGLISFVDDDGSVMGEKTAEISGTFFADADMPDNEQLLESFMEETFDLTVQETASAPGLTSGDLLTDVNRKLYDALKAEIVKIAEGSRGSTEISVSLEQAGMSGSWTAAQLGIDSIVEDHEISSAAIEKLKAKFPYDISLVLTSLMADLPYDFFWYDKVQGVSWADPDYYHAVFDLASCQYKLSYANAFSFQFYVSAEYAGTSEFTVDSSVISSIQTAMQNARQIISDNVIYTDYMRLKAYKDKICSLVSYNRQAASSVSTEYGNPWQMIWVFDGDPDTNVVCEGYAKAFQYLCDMSDFIEPVSCASVSGNCTVNYFGSSVTEGHMWNVVTMGDGLHYLVDVTNCDTGTVGADDLLFMAGYASHPSSASYTFSLKAGIYINYTYDNSTLAVNTGDALEISPSSCPSSEEYTCNGGMPHTIEIIPAVEPDCTHTGLTAGKVCSVCGKVFVEQETVLIPVSLCEVSLSDTSFVYDGTAKKPDVSVLANDILLEEGRDYNVNYSGNVSAGTASVKITGSGSYTGTVTKNFKITKAGVTLTGKDLTLNFSSRKRTVQMPVSVSPNVSHTFASGLSKVRISTAGKLTIPASFAGKVKITVKTTNANYVQKTGSWYLTVLPKAVTISKVSRTSGTTALVKWKKNAKATSYQIQYALNKAFTKGVKTKSVKKSLTKVTLKSLKKKTYYVRVRCVVKNSNGTCYSAWSKAKKIKK